MTKEEKRTILKNELLKVKGTVFKRHGRDIVVDFKIQEPLHTGKHDIELLFENDPDWWGMYWYMKHEGGLDDLKKLNQELNKSEYHPKGYYHIVGSPLYTDQTYQKMCAATITIMV